MGLGGCIAQLLQNLMHTRSHGLGACQQKMLTRARIFSTLGQGKPQVVMGLLVVLLKAYGRFKGAYGVVGVVLFKEDQAQVNVEGSIPRVIADKGLINLRRIFPEAEFKIGEAEQVLGFFIVGA